MEMTTEQWTPNCGAPLDPAKVKAGYTWDAGAQQWVKHKSFRAPFVWWVFFGCIKRPSILGRGRVKDLDMCTCDESRQHDYTTEMLVWWVFHGSTTTCIGIPSKPQDVGA